MELFYLFSWSAAFIKSQQQNQFSLSKYFSFPDGSGIICKVGGKKEKDSTDKSLQGGETELNSRKLLNGSPINPG